MIGRLTGRLIEKGPHEILVETGGVGYRVFTPLSTFCALPALGSDVSLRIHTHVREDAIALYGFETRLEQSLFERLIDISGIGPRLALAILSGLPADDLLSAIASGDGARLRRIPGVGPRTADRVILELRERVSAMRPADSSRAEGAEGGGTRDEVRRDVISALVNLGYHADAAEEAVRQAAAAADEEGRGTGPELLQDLLKRSLRRVGAARAGQAGTLRSGR